MAKDAEEETQSFGRWTLVPGQRLLLCEGVSVALGSRAFDLLLALVEARGAILSKDALLRRIWPGTVVEENNLQVQMSALRRAFGEDAAGLIATIPGRGYCFTGLPAPPAHAPEAPVPGPAPGLPDPRAVLAVMPFRNLSGDPEQDYFADGITEDLTTALSHLRWFSVIARNSAFTYKGRAVDVRQIGRELGAGYVLEGSVRRSGCRLRIALQLCDTVAGRQLWGERVDGELADIFALQDQVCEAVCAAIEPSLRQAEIERIRGKPTANLGAYDLYLRALPHRPTTRAGNEEAIGLLRRAIALDPGFAAPKGALAGQVVLRVTQGWAVPAELAEALGHARDLVEADRVDDPTALAWAGHAMTFLGRDYEAGLAATDRAMRHAPNSGTVLFLSGWNHLYVEDWRTTVTRIERALRLSPVDPSMFYFTSALAAACFVGGDDPAVADWARRSIQEHPGYLVPHRLLAASLAWLGRMEEARAATAGLLRVAPGYTVADAAAHSAFRGATRARYLEGLRRAGLPEGAAVPPQAVAAAPPLSPEAAPG